MPAYASSEMLMPAYLPGTAPIATPDQIIFVLGDFRATYGSWIYRHRRSRSEEASRSYGSPARTAHRGDMLGI
jgi:hypothetical protein